MCRRFVFKGFNVFEAAVRKPVRKQYALLNCWPKRSPAAGAA